MLARLKIVWVQVRDSLWFIPGLLTLAAAVLAVAVTEAERHEAVPAVAEWSWLFAGGEDGARGVLGAIAGGLITVTGVVFSVTIVALQLASSQFTPRVLRNFTADRGNQVVLGVFIATFTYALLVLRTVHGEDPTDQRFVPRLAVTLGVALTIVSVGFLIFFINHAARSIQVTTILARVTKETLAGVDRLFPEHVGHTDDASPPDPRRPERASVLVHASDAGYLQAVDARALFDLGRRRSLVIGMEPRIGDFVLPGEALAAVWPAAAVDGELAEEIRGAYVLGPERTPDQDVEFGIIEIADIAVRALSPGINDPTTALRCIDRLGEILLALGTRAPPKVERTREGDVHFIANYTPFERALGLAFDQIAHYGAENRTVMLKLLDTLARLHALVPRSRRPGLERQAEAVLTDARAGMENPAGLRAVEALAARRFARRGSGEGAGAA